jgi:hypothetical protein
MLPKKIRDFNNSIESLFDKLLPGLEEMCKDIHQNPELPPLATTKGTAKLKLIFCPSFIPGIIASNCSAITH